MQQISSVFQYISIIKLLVIQVPANMSVEELMLENLHITYSVSWNCVKLFYHLCALNLPYILS